MNHSTTSSKPKSSTNIFQDKNFYIINLVTVIGILGGTLYNPALPTIQEFFKVTEDQAAWISTIYQLPSAIITPIFGILADTLGRKQILIPSLLVFALGGAFSGLATNFNAHLGWRFVQGVGATSLEPLQLTIIGDLYQGRKLGTAMAFNAGLIGISGALFPLLGGILGQFDWRYTFLLGGLIAIPAVLLVITTLRLPRQQKPPEKFNFKSYMQSTWSSVNNRHVLGLFFALMSLFLLQTLCLTFIPFLARNRFHTQDMVNGVLLTVISIALAGSAAQLGRITQKLSEIKLIKLSFILFAIALLILPLIPNVWLLLIPLLLLGAAQGFALPSCQALLAGLSAQESRGGFTALNVTFLSWGQTLGPLLGSIALKFWGIQAVFYASAVIAVVSFAIFNYLLTTKVFDFTAKTLQLQIPDPTEQQTLIPRPGATQEPIGTKPPVIASPTILQQPVAQLVHLQTKQVIELPEHFEVLNIGKSSDKKSPEVDLSDFANSGVVSRSHAQIRFDGTEYYIQDMNSSNGTFINNYPVIPGVWYKLKSGIRIGFGRRDMITFMFAID